MTFHYKRIKPTNEQGKNLNKRYVVLVDNKLFKFYDHSNAWAFINGVIKHGLDYAEEVHYKIMCLYQLGQLKKSKRTSPDCHEVRLRKMLLSLESSILMDNAVRGILVGDYTLDQLLIRKGF